MGVRAMDTFKAATDKVYIIYALNYTYFSPYFYNKTLVAGLMGCHVVQVANEL